MAKSKDKGKQKKSSSKTAVKAATPAAKAATQKVKNPGPTNILHCSCKSPAQDGMYGQGMRVHNRTMKTPGWRCTVCSAIKS